MEGFSAGLVDDRCAAPADVVLRGQAWCCAGALRRPASLPARPPPRADVAAGPPCRSNLFEWAVTILGPPDTLYEGGFFNAVLKFPKDYPQSPPECRFTSEMWHPNGAGSVGGTPAAACTLLHPAVNWGAFLPTCGRPVLVFIKMLHCTAVHSRPASEPAPTSRARTPPAVFPDGRVCISILHPPGDDQYGYEQASERWSPVHGVSGGRARATDVRARGMLTAWLWPGMQLPQPASQPAWRYCTRISQVESIILSIISMLSSPNDESPANIDAAKQWREDRDGFKKKVCVG